MTTVLDVSGRQCARHRTAIEQALNYLTDYRLF